MKNKKVYAAILRKARQVLAYTNDEQNKIDELKKKLEWVENTAEDFKSTHADALARYEELQEQIKNAEKELKDAKKAWAKETGYDIAVKEAFAMMKEVEKVSINLDDIGIKIASMNNLSKQPSYKEWLEVVDSLLNDPTEKKYIFDLLSKFNKIVDKINVGCKFLDAESKDWQQEVKDIYEERNLKLPKAGVRIKAGFMDVIKNIGNAIRNTFNKVIGFFKQFGRECSVLHRDAKRVNDKLAKIR